MLRLIILRATTNDLARPTVVPVSTQLAIFFVISDVPYSLAVIRRGVGIPVAYRN
jgi:hypothetical protein